MSGSMIWWHSIVVGCLPGGSWRMSSINCSWFMSRKCSVGGNQLVKLHVPDSMKQNLGRSRGGLSLILQGHVMRQMPYVPWDGFIGSELLRAQLPGAKRGWGPKGSFCNLSPKRRAVATKYHMSRRKMRIGGPLFAKEKLKAGRRCFQKEQKKIDDQWEISIILRSSDSKQFLQWLIHDDSVRLCLCEF